ncbi:glycerate kinase type-2 family protein [Thiolapillus sp.]
MESDINTSSERERYRRDLLDIYLAALKSVNGEQAVVHWLAANTVSACAVIAIGKAAPAMMRGASQALGKRLEEGLLITRQGYADLQFSAHARIIQLESSHPVPDENSLDAGQALLDFIGHQPSDRPLLFLISGGASSLVEMLRTGVALDDLQRLNRWLLGSGLDIHAMNGLRRRLSAIKGGGLLEYLQVRPVTVLLISDVPGDDPGVIGSGLLFPHQAPKLPSDLPDWLASLPPPVTDSVNATVPHFLVATSAQAVKSAVDRAQSLGYAAWADYPQLLGNATEQGVAFARFLEEAPPGVHVLGGETTVVLPSNPGRGGRNQHLALSAAREIAGRDDLFILAAGTDGSDGPGGDAGALVDGQTWQRALDKNCDPDLALRQADSGSVLAVTGDLIDTGPTGTNVMDLLIGLKLPAGS